jgi:hypothetical protein
VAVTVIPTWPAEVGDQARSSVREPDLTQLVRFPAMKTFRGTATAAIWKVTYRA